MTIKQVSESLGLHYNTVRKYVALNLIHAIKIGKAYSISEDEVDRIKKEGISLPKDA